MKGDEEGELGQGIMFTNSKIHQSMAVVLHVYKKYERLFSNEGEPSYRFKTDLIFWGIPSNLRLVQRKTIQWNSC